MLRFAVAVVRAWTSLYTWRMSKTLQEERRAEIESDLWEFQRDAADSDPLSVASHMLLRLLIGIPDDLGWRAEHIVAVQSAQAHRTISLSASAVGALLFLCALSIIN